MENTLENKAKFFAQYAFTVSRLWHTQMDYQCTDICELLLKKDKVDKVFHGNDSAELTFWQLPLKPLSSITDEDAIGCHKIHYAYDPHKYIPENIELYVKNTKKYIIRPVEVCIPAVIDYLRSKGYALPYMGLSVETMISYGWIKLAE